MVENGHGSKIYSLIMFTEGHCLLALFSLKREKQHYHWKCLFKAWSRVNTVPAVQIL